MFAVQCPSHGSQMLLGARSIETLENTPHGVVIHWRCHCGTTGTQLVSRRAALEGRPGTHSVRPAA